MRNNNARKKRFLALLLSGMMFSSFAVALASCTNSSSSPSDDPEDETTTATQQDNGAIKNASFEIFNDNDGLNVIGTSVSSWSRKVNSPTSGSALSSKAASGIVDTTKWDEMTTSNFPDANFSEWEETDAKNNWSNMTVKDKLAYYDAWKDKNDDDDRSLSDLEFYQSFNIDSEDLPTCVNPRTHDYEEGMEITEDTNTNVLMIHNEYATSSSSSVIYKTMGTAQKYESSSTVTVKAGTSAQFSVWVKTSDLASTSTNGESQAAVDKGAYISIINTLGSSSMDPLLIKNINTYGTETNNGWVQYNFYLQGSAYTDATFTVVLGLGLGGGTDRSEYVNGYAFFDDIECTTITNEAYATATGYNAATDSYPDTTYAVYHNSEKSDKTLNANNNLPYTKYALDFAPTATAEASDVLSDPDKWNIKATTEKSTNGTVYTAASNAANAQTYLGLGIDTSYDTTKVFTTKASMLQEATANEANGSKYLKSVYDKHFASSTFIKDDTSVLMLLSAYGAAYTANSDLMTIELAPNEYKAISFFVKTSAMNGFTGANITLKDGDTKTTISSLDTTTLTSVDIDENNKDIYEGWQRCYFFISNETDETQSCTISFGFGPTTVMDTTMSSYYTGFAAFTMFTEYDFADEKAFDLVSSGEYSKIVSLEGRNEEAEGDGGFDSVATLPTDAIETGFANPTNYKGVYADSDYVKANDGTNTAINTNETAGLLNKEHKANYTTILEKMGGSGATWESVIGEDATQPLVIYNEGEQTLSYGFIGNSVTVSAGGDAVAVSLRVKISKGAKASVYLIDTDDDSYSSVLSIGSQLVYWYDDDGNVCAKDPNSKGFNAKNIAFYKKSNGLYQVNTSWSGASGADATKYYANLSAYEKDPLTQDLLVAEGGVSYDYTDKWLNDGNDGVAFYYKDGKYYANSAKLDKDEVLDLASVAALAPRYEVTDNNRNKTLSFELYGQVETPVWQTVEFYIKPGDVDKNYRLEVWSGSRDSSAAPNAEGSYVIFDSYAVSGSSFSSLLELRKTQIYDSSSNKNATDLISSTYGEYFESVYSFYDSAKFLRYDQTADENTVGDSYESYLSSSATQGVAYLKYANGAAHEMYVDYSYLDQTTSADVETDDEEEEEEQKTATDAASVWMLGGSIMIAAVLVFAVAAVIVRKLLAKRRRRLGYHETKVKKEKKDKDK